MYVCVCNGITDRDIHSAVEDGATHVDELAQDLGVATCCGECKSCARDVLNSALGEIAARIGHAA